MKDKAAFARKDAAVILGCAVFVLASLGAIGSTGRRRAKEAVCVSNLLKWGIVWKSYTDDNDGYFPPRGVCGGSWAGTTLGWAATAQPYYDDPKLLLCPEATRTWAERANNPHMAWESDLYEDGPYFRGSYGINVWVANSGDCGGGGPYFDEWCWRTPNVKGASYVPMLLDGQWMEMQPYPEDEPLLYEQDLWTPGPYDEMRRACVNRHNGVNSVYMDLSVRKVGLKHLWRLRWHREWPEDYPPPVWPDWMQNFKDY